MHTCTCTLLNEWGYDCELNTAKYSTSGQKLAADNLNHRLYTCECVNWMQGILPITATILKFSHSQNIKNQKWRIQAAVIMLCFSSMIKLIQPAMEIPSFSTPLPPGSRRFLSFEGLRQGHLAWRAIVYVVFICGACVVKL